MNLIMKKLILFCLVLGSLSAMARPWEDYVCSARQYTVEITVTQDTSTHFWLMDGFETLAHGYAKSLERKGEKTTYYFYPGQAEPAKITFKTQDVIDQPETIEGRIETTARGFLLWDRLTCKKVH